MPRTSQGRQRITMEKIGNESSLSVAFAKRRSGIFKKASELCTLCGVEIAILIFSPSDKVFSFGHPSLEKLVDRFLKRTPASTSTSSVVEHHRNSSIIQLNGKLTDLLEQVEAWKKTGQELDKQWVERTKNFWWDGSIESLGVEELDQLKLAMLDMKTNAEKEVERLMVKAANPSGVGSAGPST